jgi:hypothetical protein
MPGDSAGEVVVNNNRTTEVVGKNKNHGIL